MKLKAFIPLSVLKEAEKKKDEKDTAADDSGEAENPFAAADAEDAGGEEADAKGDEKGTEEEGDAKTSEEAKPLEVVFNPNRVRKYNKVRFQGNKGLVTAISRSGLTVTLPDQTTVFVNFDDII